MDSSKIKDEKIKKFFDVSINELKELDFIPTEKAWNKLAGKNTYMTSISLRKYSGINSWSVLCNTVRNGCVEGKGAIKKCK